MKVSDIANGNYNVRHYQKAGGFKKPEGKEFSIPEEVVFKNQMTKASPKPPDGGILEYTYRAGDPFQVPYRKATQKGKIPDENDPHNNFEQANEEKPIGEYTTEELMERIQEEMDKIREKVKNGDTEVSFQIGGESFTIKEWDKLLDKFDSAQDAVRKLMEEKEEDRMEEESTNDS